MANSKSITIPLDDDLADMIAVDDQIHIEVVGRVISIKGKTATLSSVSTELIDVESNS